MENKKNKRHVIGVLGLGLFGSAVVREISSEQVDVIAVDRDQKKVDRLDEYLAVGIAGDFSEDGFLEQADIGRCETVVVASGSNLEAMVLAVVTCRDLGVKNIICKAKSKSVEKVLKALNVDRIIIPEEESGKRMGNLLGHNTLRNMFQLDDEVSIFEFLTPEAWAGKSIIDLNVRQDFDMNILGLRHHQEEKLDTHFDVKAPLKISDTIVALMSSEALKQLDEIDAHRTELWTGLPFRR